MRATWSSQQGWRIHWRLATPVQFDPSNKQMVIERSDGPAGPWEEVIRVPMTVYHADDPIYTRAMWQRHFWRLTLLDLSNDPATTLLRSQPFSFGHEQNRIMAELIRQHELRLRPVNGKYNGMVREFAVYKRSSWGDYCPHCVDAVTSKTFLDRCEVCLGTRYIQGWMDPSKLTGYFLQPSEVVTMHGTYGKAQERRNTLRTSNRVIVEAHDVLVEARSGVIWQVLSATNTTPSDTVITQNVEIEQIPADRIESSLSYPEAWYG
jgi:hypothetical protein